MNLLEDCLNNELDEYLKRFKNHYEITSEIHNLEHKLQEIYNINKVIEKYKFFNYKNVHVTLKFEIKPEILDNLKEDKYGLRTHIYGLFKETFVGFQNIKNIPIKIILYKLYLHRKTLEITLKKYFENLIGFKGGKNIYELESFLYLRIEKLLEKQINLLKKNPDIS